MESSSSSAQSGKKKAPSVSPDDYWSPIQKLYWRSNNPSADVYNGPPLVPEAVPVVPLPPNVSRVLPPPPSASVPAATSSSATLSVNTATVDFAVEAKASEDAGEDSADEHDPTDQQAENSHTKPNSTKRPAPSSSSSCSSSSAAQPSATAKPKLSKRAKKKQRKEMERQELCRVVAQGGTCTNKHCPRLHDLAAFVSTQSSPPPGACPAFRRFITGHTPPASSSLPLDQPQAQTSSSSSSFVCAAGPMCRWAVYHPALASSPLPSSSSSSPSSSSLPAYVDSAVDSGGRLIALNRPSAELARVLWRGAKTYPRAEKVLKALSSTSSANSTSKPLSFTSVALSSTTATNTTTTPSSSELSSLPSSSVPSSHPSLPTSSIPSTLPASSNPSLPACPPSTLASPSLPSASLSNESWAAPLRAAERARPLDYRGKIYVAPLTTIGNLPFRVVLSRLGADITCGEMAMCRNLLDGQRSEWALLRRHPAEKCFGIQLATGTAQELAQTCELLADECKFDFLDLNSACPIDVVYHKGMGAALLERPRRLFDLCRAASSLLPSTPLTVKLRIGKDESSPTVHRTVLPHLAAWGVSAAVLHGRSREQRYSRLANWSYLQAAARLSSVPLLGNGDVYSWQDYWRHLESPADDGDFDLDLSSSSPSPLKQQQQQQPGDQQGISSHPSSLDDQQQRNNTSPSSSSLAGIMLARGAIVKPWLPAEIKDRRDWDISASERLELLRQYCELGLDHWGSDTQGVEQTREFLLQWMSFLHRYVPVGLLERLPSRIHHRPVPFCGRSQLETLLASPKPEDWVKISSMFLGPPRAEFTFTPKHKSAAWDEKREDVCEMPEG